MKRREKLKVHLKKGGGGTVQGSRKGLDMIRSQMQSVGWLSDKQRSVLSNSNTPQSTLGSGSPPAQ